MKKLAYVQIKFDEELKQKWNDLLSKITKPEDFYYSPEIKHIQGNVTENAHLTLFFGLLEEELQNKDLRNFLDNIKPVELSFDQINLVEGYQNLYKIMILKLSQESTEKLLPIHDEIKNYKYDSSAIHKEFSPHVTLAYVNNHYDLPSAASVNCKTIAKEFILSEYSN